MNISAPFIHRPVATTLMMLALVIAGWLGWRALPVASLPQVDYPMIQVFTFQPGASPDLVARRVTAVLEQQLGKISGVQQMTSATSPGVSVITLQFGLNENMASAEQSIQAAINQADLPDGLKAPPIYRKVNPADAPVLSLAITSSSASLPLTKVHSLIETRLIQKLAQTSGVGLLTVNGGQKPAIRIAVNPQALAAAQIDIEQVHNAIQIANVNQPKGVLTGKYRSTNISANDQLTSIADYENIAINWQNGAALRLKDIAKISQGAEDSYVAAWFNRKPAILLNIQRQPGANVIEVVKEIKRQLPAITAALPNTIEINIATDRTLSIKASVDDVKKELLFAILLVVLVTFVFLRRATLALIPSVAIPLSLIGTLAVMYYLNFSINNLSLMALIIATGFVVDDAVVMMENIVRYHEKGMTAIQAALVGAKEIGFTLISLTVSLIAVLIPLFFMADLVGRLFYEFSVTIAVAIGISLLVSLTLTPMMSAKLLQGFKHKNTNNSAGNSSAKKRDYWQKIVQFYADSLRWSLNHSRLMLTVLLCTMAFTVLLYWLVPKGFFPVQDNAVIQATMQVPANSSFALVARKQDQVSKILLKHPDVKSVATIVGVDGYSNDNINESLMQINLQPHGQRTMPVNKLLAQLQQQVSQVADVQFWLQLVQELSVESKTSKSQYQLSFIASEQSRLSKIVPKVMSQLKQLPELVGLTSDLQQQAKVLRLNINRDKALQLGVSIADVLQSLQSSFAQRQVSTLYSDNNQFQVILEMAPDFAQGNQALQNLHVKGSKAMVALSAIASFETQDEPIFKSRLDQLPTVTISFNLAEKYSLGQSIESIEQKLQQMQLPADINWRFQGSAKAFQASLTNTLWLMLAAVVAMYIVLGILYESYIHPLTILSTLPSALVGALFALLVTGTALDLIAIIGLILLLGLVKKNGIMLVDFALHAQREQNLTAKEAVYQAALLRFRPIFMTTMAAILGALPLLLSTGVGSELRRPLGLVMIAGLIVSQILTLYTTPAVYLWFDKLGKKIGSPTAAIATVERES